MRTIGVSAVCAAVLLAWSAVGAAQGSGGGQGIAVQFQVVATPPPTCPTAGIVFETQSAGTFTYYTCPTAGSAPVQIGSGGGGGVTSLQVDAGGASTGAVQLISGNALSSSCSGTGQTSPCTFNVSSATGAQVGVLALATDLAGTASAPTVVGLHFGATALTLATAPADGQNLCRSGTTVTGCSGAAAPLTLTSPAAADVPLSIVGASGQSGDLLDFTANGGAVGGLARMDPFGDLVVNQMTAASGVHTNAYFVRDTQTISGCALSAAVGGQSAGEFVAGATSCTVTVTLPASANGWTCWANDITTPADLMHQSAVGTTSVTITGTVAVSDKINYGCVGY